MDLQIDFTDFIRTGYDYVTFANRPSTMHTMV